MKRKMYISANWSSLITSIRFPQLSHQDCSIYYKIIFPAEALFPTHTHPTPPNPPLNILYLLSSHKAPHHPTLCKTTAWKSLLAASYTYCLRRQLRATNGIPQTLTVKKGDKQSSIKPCTTCSATFMNERFVSNDWEKKYVVAASLIRKDISEMQSKRKTKLNHILRPHSAESSMKFFNLFLKPCMRTMHLPSQNLEGVCSFCNCNWEKAEDKPVYLIQKWYIPTLHTSSCHIWALSFKCFQKWLSSRVLGSIIYNRVTTEECKWCYELCYECIRILRFPESCHTMWGLYSRQIQFSDSTPIY